MDNVKQTYKFAQLAVRSRSRDLIRQWAAKSATASRVNGHQFAHDGAITALSDMAPASAFNGAVHNRAKILFLRQNAIGDALISTPIYAALKRHYPDLTIDVLLNRRNREVYENDANIRRTYVIKMRPLDLIPVLRLIRREKYDFIVDLVHSPSSTSSAICLLAGAGKTIGGAREDPLRHPPDKDYAYDIRIPPPPDGRRDRMLLRLAQCLRVFGVAPGCETLAPVYQCRSESIAFAEDLLGSTRTSTTDHIIGVNISGAKAYKYWGSDNFIALINRLSTQFPSYKFLLLYSAQYQAEAENISRATGAAISGGTPTLDSFAAIIQRLDGLISPDSAAVHFADSAGVPVVMLMIDPLGHHLWCPSRSSYRALHAVDRSLKTISVGDVEQAVSQLQPDITRRTR